ncbi:MAG: SPOR domain-containing protein [Candidatus Manganitrophaceae bacterium]
MRDLEELKREEGSGPKRPFSYLIVGMMGVLVFVGLVFFFRGKEEKPAPVLPAPVDPTTLQTLQTAPSGKEPSEGGEEVLSDETLKPGQIRFDSKGDPFPVGDQQAPPPEKDQSSRPPIPGGLSTKKDLTFFETLKDKKEKNLSPSPKKESPPKRQTEPAKTALAPESGSVKSSSSARLYTIQVASFTEKKGAETLIDQLKRKGYPVYLETGEIHRKGRFYRVRVGHYSSRAEAQKEGERIGQAEKLNFLVTAEEGK